MLDLANMVLVIASGVISGLNDVMGIGMLMYTGCAVCCADLYSWGDVSPL